MQAAQAVGPIVPVVVPTRFGDTVASVGSAAWDVTSWMPGDPITSTPTTGQLEGAAAALASLHLVWSRLRREQAPCPAVRRRLALLDDWERAPCPAAFDHLPADLADLLQTSKAALSGRLDDCRAALSEWRSVPVTVQPCLCDVHAEHILFTGSRVSGVIDYGAMQADSPAVDVARFLGDLAPSDSPLFAAGLQAYLGANPAAHISEPLVRMLADTTAVCGLANWHLRLSNRPPPDADRVKCRLRKLLVQAIPPSH
jgi:homoserine kinase type II